MLGYPLEWSRVQGLGILRQLVWTWLSGSFQASVDPLGPLLASRHVSSDTARSVLVTVGRAKPS
jgi:hypothetical protein